MIRVDEAGLCQVEQGEVGWARIAPDPMPVRPSKPALGRRQDDELAG
jgi:hypothetical protein